MKNPLVSVIVTTKNEEGNIGRLLKSIKKQSYKNLEIIVVDNNSADQTKEISLKFTPNVFNKGPERSAQRNYGVLKANGEYVVILDADMELTKDVVKSCLMTINDYKHSFTPYKALVVPEKTVGNGFIAAIRKFEREMYMKDSTIEVARFFVKKVFEEFDGYDLNLTGAEDFDLPKRISQKYKIGRSKEYILHHEGNLTLGKQLKKKFYYAQKSALYAEKHPDLISRQGILILRRAYLKHWKKFIKYPGLGVSLIIFRALETIAAASGFLKAVGPIHFVRTFFKMLKYI